MLLKVSFYQFVEYLVQFGSVLLCQFNLFQLRSVFVLHKTPFFHCCGLLSVVFICFSPILQFIWWFVKYRRTRKKTFVLIFKSMSRMLDLLCTVLCCDRQRTELERQFSIVEKRLLDEKNSIKQKYASHLAVCNDFLWMFSLVCSMLLSFRLNRPPFDKEDSQRMKWTLALRRNVIQLTRLRHFNVLLHVVWQTARAAFFTSKEEVLVLGRQLFTYVIITLHI